MLIIQVGQCGIQVGRALESALLDEKTGGLGASALVNAEFGTLIVDTEHKTWSADCLGSGKTLPVRRVVDGGRLGRGNVWTFGYGTSHEKVMDGVRLFLERYSSCRGFILLHSVGGGTGSGFGSRILQLLRESYPEKPIYSVSVLPFLSGDAPLQSYNALLSLSFAQEFSDVVSLFSNDSLLQQSAGQGLHGATGKLAKPFHQKQQMADLNKLAAQSLARIISPVYDHGSPAGRRQVDWLLTSLPARRVSLWDIVQSVVPMPSLKYVMYGTSAEHKKNSFFPGWSHLSESLSEPVKVLSTRFSLEFPEQQATLLASQLYVRGYSANVTRELEKLERPGFYGFKKKSCYTPYPIDVILSNGQEESLSLLFNSNLVQSPLVAIHEKAKKMYEKRAYIHWYEKYWLRCSSADVLSLFSDCFDLSQKVIDAYSQL